MLKKFRVLTPFKTGGGILLPVLTAILLPCGVSSAEENTAETENANVDIRNYLESEDFILTAERIPTNRWDTPANVHVITSEEIEENHYQTIEEALSHVNGIVTIISGATTSGEVIMNGNERVLLLINGHRANNTQDGFTSRKSELSVIPSIKMVERIEIVKGGSSALYGTDAVGGVINIITKKGTRNETVLDISAGSWQRYNMELTNQGEAGKFSWFVSGGLGTSHAYKYKGDADTLSDTSDYNENGVSIRMDNQFDDRNSLTFETFHHTRHYNSDNSSGIYNDISLSYNFKEGTNVPGWLRYYNDYRKTSTPGGGITKARIQGLEYQNGWELGRHKIIAGLEYHRNNLDQEYYGLQDKKSSNIAVYLQDTIRLGNKWTLIPGARYDKSREFGKHWSPKIAANYRADEKTKFYASWGRVYREPTLTEQFSNNLWMLDYDSSRSIYLGGKTFYDTYLHSETGHTETVGVEHNFDENTNVTLNFFNSKLNHGIYWGNNIIGELTDDTTGLPTDLYAHISENLLTEKRRGIELTFNQKLNDYFSYNIGYSHTKISDYGVSVSNDYGQPNGYRLGLHYQNRGLRANLLGIMASGLNIETDENHYGFISKRYAVFNFNLGYDFNETSSIYFKANNFTNQNYSNVSKYSHSPGRQFIVGATFRF